MSRLEKLGRVTAAHPWRTVAAWLVAAAALTALGQVVGGAFVNDFRAPGVESQHAADLTREHFPEYGAASAEIVWSAGAGAVADRRAGIDAMLAEVRRQPDVTDVGEVVVSPQGSAATATVRYGREVGELGRPAYERLQAAAAPARDAGLAVEFRGLVADAGTEPTTDLAELVGLGVALLVLLVAFGSVVAAGVPILIAVAGLAAGTALVLLVGSVVDIPTAAPIVAVMLGLGAGIDYALFVLTRFRQALADGLGPVAAAGRATATAGRAVLVAGGTVVVAILGLWFAGIPFVAAMGLAAALTVAVMVCAALTLLPALLGLLGRRVDALRVLRHRPGAAPTGPGRWDRWGEHVARHRWAYAVATVAGLLLLATPVLWLRLGTPDDGSQPVTLSQRRAYDVIAAQFGPGWNAPLLVTVEGGSDQALARLTGALAADPEVALAAPPRRSPDGAVALLTVLPRHAPQDAEVTDLVHRVRRTLAPAALAPDGGRAYVGGPTAFVIDLAEVVGRRLPWVVAAVVLAATALLLAMFRAPVVALKAAVATLLSIGVAFGVIIAVFQWGWGLSLLGVDKPVPIMSVVPMLLFAILFGLSMDYEVFLLSAVREAYERTGEPRRAVAEGLAATGRVITAAALIMACVFATFVSIQDSLVKMIGVGLATAVIVDATVIRVVLVPAVMALLGRSAWWPVAPARQPLAGASRRVEIRVPR